MCRAVQTVLQIARGPRNELIRQLRPCSTALFQNLVVARIPKNLPHFMEHDGSSPFSQHPVIGPYPQRDESSPYLDNLFKIHFNINLKFIYQSSTRPHFKGFLIQMLHAYLIPPMHATFPVISLFLIDHSDV